MSNPDPGPWHRILDPEVDGPKLPTDEWWNHTKTCWEKVRRVFPDGRDFVDGMTYRRRKWITDAPPPVDVVGDDDWCFGYCEQKPNVFGWDRIFGWSARSQWQRGVIAWMLYVEGETEPPEPYRPTEEPSMGWAINFNGPAATPRQPTEEPMGTERPIPGLYFYLQLDDDSVWRKHTVGKPEDKTNPATHDEILLWLALTTRAPEQLLCHCESCTDIRAELDDMEGWTYCTLKDAHEFSLRSEEVKYWHPIADMPARWGKYGAMTDEYRNAVEDTYLFRRPADSPDPPLPDDPSDAVEELRDASAPTDNVGVDDVAGVAEQPNDMDGWEYCLPSDATEWCFERTRNWVPRPPSYPGETCGYLFRRPTQQPEQPKPDSNPIDKIAASRGWNPLVEGESMTVHFDGKEYKITRQPPGFSRAVETIKEACNEMEPEQPKQNKDPCEKCDGKGYYCVNLPLEGDPPDNRRHCEICGGKGYREQPKRERRERGIIVSRNGSETLCRNYPNTIVIGRQTEYRVREVLPGDPDPDEQAEIRQWMDSDDPRKYRLETLELGLREAAERWGVKASFVSRCERGQNASARDMEVLHAKLTPHVQGRLDEQAAETERWNLAADDYRRKWYETQDMQVAVESERDQLAAELEAVKAVKEVSISRSCGECEFWQFGCRGFNKHKDEGYCNLTPTQINKQRGDWCAQFRPKGTPPTKADSQ